MKVFFKILMILMILFCVNCLFFYDAVEAAFDYSNTVSYINSNKAKGNAVTSMQQIMGALFRIIRIVGSSIAFIMLAWVAIHYMQAAPDDKAEIKKSATAYIVGAIILFATANLVAIIANFAVSNT